uniref:Uncharacterized protein n=1 Tax=Streptomyces refuineus subsp. thermotolerans TaxID=223297 RepID=A8W7F1_9ACTN|nr:hypothetical protein [Streptomyces refuineus subsp. thermotolerans]
MKEPRTGLPIGTPHPPVARCAHDPGSVPHGGRGNGLVRPSCGTHGPAWEATGLPGGTS